ncbi:MAG TPA: hypothetical protein DCS15_03280 [Flavobacteriales bacterium]|nr:GNAT family N-acetyltransferase [Salibacteraceae bacterium]HAS35482.1 hypothetical protein [Flavobacteriales bacterium]
MDKLEILKSLGEKFDLPIFYQDIWFESFDPDSWDLVLSGEVNDPKAVWPFMKKKKMGFTKITQAWLNPYGGPWLFYPKGQKDYARMSFEKKVIDELYGALPKHDAIACNLYPSLQNHLPFKWLGFEQTTQYTYLLDLKLTEEELREGLNGNIRREINKATRNKIDIVESDELEDLHRLKILDYEQKGMPIGYSFEDFEKRFRPILITGKAKVLYALQDGKRVSGILLLWDKHQAYYLVGATDPNTKGNGIFSFLLFQAILEAQKHVDTFNFEGSVIEAIEKFFRSFGSRQQPYHVLSKYQNKKLKALDQLRKGQ